METINPSMRNKKTQLNTRKHSQKSGIRTQDKMKAFFHLCTIKEPQWLTWLQELPFLLHKQNFPDRATLTQPMAW